MQWFQNVAASLQVALASALLSLRRCLGPFVDVNATALSSNTASITSLLLYFTWILILYFVFAIRLLAFPGYSISPCFYT